MPLRRLNLLNTLGNLINPATEEKQDDAITQLTSTVDKLTLILAGQVDGGQKTKIVDSGGSTMGMIGTESGNAAAVYQTDRPDSGLASYHREDLSSGTYPVVLVDISDNINYNHTLTNYAHLHMREFDIKSDINGAWNLSLGFVENITPSGADFYIYKRWRGGKDIGNDLHDDIVTFPTGAAFRSESLTTMSSASADFKSDVLVPSSKSFITPDVFPEQGDVVILLEVTGGNVLEFSCIVGYHSH